MNCTRRNFLIGGSTTLFLSGYFPKISFASMQKKNLIIISLRGGMDGLTAVPVIGDKSLKKLRKKLILEDVLNLNSDFGLHPKLEIFHKLWERNQAAFVHATNIPYTGRSHFDGQNLMESGGKVPYEIKTGWLGRGMSLAGLTGNGLALSLPMPLLIRGVPMNDNYYPVEGTMPSEEILDIIKNEFEIHSEKDLSMTLDVIKKRKFQSYGSRRNSSLALNAGQQLSKIDGPRVAVFEVDGFDTHAAQGSANGAHADCLKEYDNIIEGLKSSLGTEFNNTLILTLTEFGRTIKQNSSNGTEHGYGSAILITGGLVKQSQVYTEWPGLKKKELFEGRDLNSTIDARSVYASAMSNVFEIDFERIRKEVFWGEKLQNLSDKLFKIS